MGLAALFTIVATNLVHWYTPVYCHEPPVGWQDTAKYRTVAVTMFGPTRIYVRDCPTATPGTLGHEILHALHPWWPESLVYAREDEEEVLVRHELRWALPAVL